MPVCTRYCFNGRAETHHKNRRRGVCRWPQTRPEPGILSVPAVLELVPVSRTTLWRLVKEGKFPRPVQVSLKRIGWRESEVMQWIAEQNPA